ncbi:hypothetical protein JTE90_012979, partial [Oedothorax gibbosus]
IITVSSKKDAPLDPTLRRVKWVAEIKNKKAHEKQQKQKNEKTLVREYTHNLTKGGASKPQSGAGTGTGTRGSSNTSGSEALGDGHQGALQNVGQGLELGLEPGGAAGTREMKIQGTGARGRGKTSGRNGSRNWREGALQFQKPGQLQEQA